MTGDIGPQGWEGPPPKSVCIVMLSAIGDAVHVMPIATALRRKWPDCRITWVIQPIPYLMVQNHPAIDEFIIYNRREGPSAWLGFYEVRKAMAGRRFDLLMGLQVYIKAGLITLMAPAVRKLGFDRPRALHWQWLFTNRRIPATGQHHVQDQYIEFLESLGIDPNPVVWEIQFSEQERTAQRAFFQQMGRPVCAVVVATSKREKNWTTLGYARVLEEVERKYGLMPVIVGGPAKEERAIADEVIAQCDVEVRQELGADLRRLMWIIQGSKLVISPDTGPMHISRALGTPVVSLFGHTNPKRTGPYRAYQDLIVDGYARFSGEDYPVSPALRDGMQRITVDDVLAKVSLAMDTHCETRKLRQ